MKKRDMKISVLMPVYNEAQYVEQVIANVCSHEEIDEIVIVNDGSTDATRQKLDALKDSRIKVIHQEKNAGKGAAVKRGLDFITGDIIIIQDADLEYTPDDYPKLIAPFADLKIEVVYGSRRLCKTNRFSYLSFAMGGILLTILTNLLFFSNITDEPTGYKVFRTDILKKIPLYSKGFEFCPEVTAKILRKGIHIHEVPIHYSPRKISEGKKIRFRDGMIAIWTLLKYRVIK